MGESELNMFDLSKEYTGNQKWVIDRTIFLTKHGSHAYGTNLPTSDIDIRGVVVAPKEYYVGFNNIVKQVEQKEPDLVIFEIRKFLSLACDANPNVLELLFTEPEDHLLITPAGQKIIDSRYLFLTKRAKYTFQGYAHSQLKRLNTHKQWLMNPVEIKPTRKEFNLPEHTLIPADQLMAAQAVINKKMDEWGWNELEHLEPGLRQDIQDEFVRRLTEITSWAEESIDDKTWRAAGISLGLNTNFMELMEAERRYQSAIKNYNNYQQWKKERNVDRALLETKFGYDTKHAMHLTRLSRSCLEILKDGDLHVKRKDAKELLEIRDGKYSLEYLLKMFDEKNQEIEEAFAKCTLPNSPDRVKIDNLCCDIVQKMIF